MAYVHLYYITEWRSDSGTNSEATVLHYQLKLIWKNYCAVAV